MTPDTMPRTGAPPRRPGLALAVIATAQLMVVLDATIVNVALPGQDPGAGRRITRIRCQSFTRDGH